MCTFKKDYEDEQGLILKNKFKEKGYDDMHRDEAFQKYLQLYESPSIEVGKWLKRDASDEKPQVRFCIRYNNRVRLIQKIFRKKLENTKPVCLHTRTWSSGDRKT